jgi:cytochrome c biogenesis protein CcmG/thiol:disulfide interchange protein DsbE
VAPSSTPSPVAPTAKDTPIAHATPTAPAAPTGSATQAPTPSPAVEVGTDVGERAPDFTLRDARGKKISLAALLGRPVWLLFWAVGCVSCEPTLGTAQRLQEQHADDGLVVVSIAVFTYPEDAEWYASELDLDYPVALDEDGQVFTRYRAVTLPAHVWIDRAGIIRD